MDLIPATSDSNLLMFDYEISYGFICRVAKTGSTKRSVPHMFG